MKKLVIGIVILLILGTIGLIALPSLIPSSVYKEKIETQLTRELGRQVSVLGDVKLSIFPVIKANAGRVEIDNPDGFIAEHFAAMDGLDARVKLMPLLSKRVEIAAFTLKNPVINLEKTAEGEVNWAFGEPSEAIEKSEGPFKRDGRYSAIDPAIGQFSLENGHISYIDTASNVSHDLREVNLDFSLSSLAAPVKIDGGLTYNNTPASVNLTLDSIRGFLDGKEAPITLALKTDFADIKTKGRFLPGQDITFNLDIDGSVSDAQKLAALSPVEIPYTDLAQSVTLSGNYGYDGTVLIANNADITAKGDSFDAGFKGNATLTETPVFDGRISLDASDMGRLAKALKRDIKGLELLETVKVTADLKAQDKGFAASNIDAVISGDGLSGSFNGQGIFGDTISADGAFSAKAASVPVLIGALGMDIPQAAVIQNFDGNGTIALSGKTITLTDLNAKTDGGAVTGNYTGTAKITDGKSAANGQFSVDIPSVPEAAQLAGLDIDAAMAVGNLSATGQIAMKGENITISNLQAKTDGGSVTGQYAGRATLGDTPAYNGNFSTSLASLTEFSQLTGINLPYAETIGKVDVKGRVSGQGENITLSDLDATLSEGQLNGNFTGTAAMLNGLSLNGTLNANAPSLRALAKTTGTELPPSTDTGAIYERFVVSGQITGTPADITIKEAVIDFDSLRGKGDLKVDLTKAKPFLTGTVNMEGLDLRPYMAAYTAQNPTGKIQPWSTVPLNMEPLRAVDGDFAFNTPNIVTDRMSLGQSNISAKLRGGVLTADLPKMALYGGLGRMNAVLDGSGSVPKIAMDLGLNDVSSNSFLGAVAGFTKATGEAGSAFKIRGSGRSQAEIMKSLTGAGDFKLVNGQISGVDLGQFLTGLDQAFSSRTLPSGLGSGHITKFKDIIGLIKIENGVAKINKFSLDGAGVLAEGAGQIDLGNQSIDFSLRPRLTGETASNLGAFGIPIKFTGNFGGIKAGLDTDLLAQVVAERAKAKAGNLIKDRIGGDAGNIIGGLLGAETRTQAPVQNQTPAQDTPRQPTAPQPQTPEQAVTDLFGGLLGVQKDQPEQTQPEPENENAQTEAPKKEPTVEDTLLSIFGGNKEPAEKDE